MENPVQVLHEAGVKLGGPDEGVGGSGGGYGSGSDGAFGGPEVGRVRSLYTRGTTTICHGHKDHFGVKFRC